MPKNELFRPLKVWKDRPFLPVLCHYILPIPFTWYRPHTLRVHCTADSIPLLWGFQSSGSESRPRNIAAYLSGLIHIRIRITLDCGPRIRNIAFLVPIFLSLSGLCISPPTSSILYTVYLNSASANVRLLVYFWTLQQPTSAFFSISEPCISHIRLPLYSELCIIPQPPFFLFWTLQQPTSSFYFWTL